MDYHLTRTTFEAPLVWLNVRNFMSYSLDQKNGTFENRPSKGRSGTSGLNFCLGLTGVKFCFFDKVFF